MSIPESPTKFEYASRYIYDTNSSHETSQKQGMTSFRLDTEVFDKEGTRRIFFG